MLRLIAVLGFAVATTGCSVFGNSKFSCNAPDGVSCQSISGGYANAMASSIPGQKKPVENKEGSPKKSGWFSEKTTKKTSKNKDELAGFKLVKNEPAVILGEGLINQKPRPLRSSEQVVGVTVFPWKDDAGTLHDISRFFFVVKDSDWNVQYTEEVNQKSFGRIRDFRSLYAK